MAKSFDKVEFWKFRKYKKTDLNSIGKGKFIKHILQEIGWGIHSMHVYSIISIMFDEIAKDLRAGKEFKIFNFGSIVIREHKPVKRYDVVHDKMFITNKFMHAAYVILDKIKDKIRELSCID
jgi:nucleoid DNA-binding protein